MLGEEAGVGLGGGREGRFGGDEDGGEVGGGAVELGGVELVGLEVGGVGLVGEVEGAVGAFGADDGLVELVEVIVGVALIDGGMEDGFGEGDGDGGETGEGDEDVDEAPEAATAPREGGKEADEEGGGQEAQEPPEVIEGMGRRGGGVGFVPGVVGEGLGVFGGGGGVAGAFGEGLAGGGQAGGGEVGDGGAGGGVFAEEALAEAADLGASDGVDADDLGGPLAVVFDEVDEAVGVDDGGGGLDFGDFGEFFLEVLVVGPAGGGVGVERRCRLRVRGWRCGRGQRSRP